MMKTEDRKGKKKTYQQCFAIVIGSIKYPKPEKERKEGQ
jgi:hypothetical protein